MTAGNDEKSERRESSVEDKFNDTLKRMLETPPKPNLKDSETESPQKRKPDGNPAKNDRPEDY